MTTFRELHVTRTDGTTQLEACERDDERGRATIDRLAFEAVQRADVMSCQAVPVDRRANTRARGSYR